MMSKSQESFENCDTDGFLSQWGHDLNDNLARVKSEIAKNGGMSEFLALFDLNGNRINAKLITGKFGLCWAFCDTKGEFTGKFISACPKRASTMEKKGYVERNELAPADACYSGSGKGLAGCCSIFVTIFRTDGK